MSEAAGGWVSEAAGAAPTAPTSPAGPPGTTEVVRLDGHVLDSLLLVKVLDAIVDSGASYRVLDLEVGSTRNDESHVRLQVTAASEASLEALLERLHAHGVNREDDTDAELAEVTQDGVLPEGFYSTTNLDTWVRVGGHWAEVARPEMDCAIQVEHLQQATGSQFRARTLPMHRARKGDLVVVGMHGVRVATPSRSPEGGQFAFMTSEISPEKPKALSVERVAASIRRARESRPGLQPRKVLVVCGPAVVHTGAAPAVAALFREGWAQVLFAGNGFATHDIEASVLGTSLGAPLAGGPRSDHGHANHLRVINTVRRFGSIARAVEAGWLRSGVLYECARAGVPFVLGGSVRDDGPLPDVVTDTVAAADAMREHLDGVGVALMLASTLHAIATGNLLSASVETFCVDINEAVVTKLADRGTHQALGIVTDVGLFAGKLADILCGPSWAKASRDSA